MARINSTGIKRSELLWALGNPALVRDARERDSCLLCRGSRVNEAGLCNVCTTSLNDAESRMVEKWMAGGSP